MPNAQFLPLFVASVLCFGPQRNASSADYFANNGYRDAVELIYHPSGHHHRGTTFLAYEGPERAPYVCAYHHETRQWQGPVKAGVNLLWETDDGHGRPSIVVDNQGYIHLVYGGHGGHRGLGENPLGTNGHGEQTHVVSSRPMDISSWRKVENVSPFGTYSQLVKSDEGHLYLFYRHGTHKSDWVYQRSKDDGRTFEPAVIVLKHKTDVNHPTLHHSWYAFFNKGTKNTVHCSFVLHPCWEKPKHDTERRNVYYLKMSLDDSRVWTNASGKVLSLPIEKEAADEHAMVFASGNIDCRNPNVRADWNDQPHIVFQRTNAQERAVAAYTRWTGSRWQSQTFPASDGFGHFSDIFVGSPDSVFVVSSIGRDDGSRGVMRSQSSDSGRTWNNDILVSGRAGWHISSAVTDAHRDGQIMFLESMVEGEATTRMYLWGESGMVERAD